jgi:REP element-mobilizing transposase RayT
MPGTYTQLLAHVVFSTKHRHPWISQELEHRLHPYIGGILRAEKAALYSIGGIEDHVHLYMRYRPDTCLSDLMRIVKSRSSLWIHETFPSLGDFTWQEGYWAFSVEKSGEAALKNYIASQHEHHHGEDFKSEIRRMLTAADIEFDERYLFD